MADQVVFVQPLHDDHDGAFGLVVEARQERGIEPFVDGIAPRVRPRFLGLQGIVDDDEIGAAAGEHTAHRGGQTKAAARGGEFRDGLFVRRECGFEQRAVEARVDQSAAVATELVGQVL